MSEQKNKTAVEVLVRTSSEGWLKQLAEVYKTRTPFLLEDDAHIGIDPRSDTLLSMGLKAKLSRREWAAVLISMGIASIGVWLLIMAVLDPEPYSKVAAAIATGAVLLGSGGFMAIRILTNIKPPNIRVSKLGTFEVYWS